MRIRIGKKTPFLKTSTLVKLKNTTDQSKNLQLFCCWLTSAAGRSTRFVPPPEIRLLYGRAVFPAVKMSPRIIVTVRHSISVTVLNKKNQNNTNISCPNRVQMCEFYVWRNVYNIGVLICVCSKCCVQLNTTLTVLCLKQRFSNKSLRLKNVRRYSLTLE